ncbi:MAG: SMC family ATPase [Thermoleophilia bacterium]|nr:SMC family ATPase [Thermoleophilia bacterium]
MRPVRLVMQAFGPYRGQQVVDFTELGANRVFLIHGDTGAGKTTILDAMVFALYGDTSGGERRPDQMRCDQASPDLRTEVVFDFLLGDRSFRIKRRPAQEVLGARAGSLVSKPAEIALWERTGCAASEEGRPIATKIREVEAQVRDLLGFSCEQFRQVVVLPQGRFRELLASGSDRREEILRQLFRTERFRELELALAERARSVNRQMDGLRAQREAQLGLAGATDDAELAALLEAAEARSLSAAEAAEKAEAAARRASDALSAAEMAGETRRAMEEARAELEALEGRSREMDDVRLRLETGARADKVRASADRLSAAMARLSEARAAAMAAGEDLLEAQKAEQAAAAALVEEEKHRLERQELADRARHLESLSAAIEAWRAAREERDEAKSRVISARTAHGELQAAETAVREGLAILEADLVEAKTAALRMEGARTRLEEAKRNEERCRRLQEAGEAVAQARRHQAELDSLEAASLSRYEEAQAGLADVEERWRSGRATALAAALRDGEPCPVCGSTEHPAPARFTAGDISDDALEAARAAVAATRQAHDHTRDISTAARAGLAGLRAREVSLREEIGPGDLSLENARSATGLCAAELEELTARAGAEAFEAEIREAEQRVAVAATATQAAAQTLADEKEALAGLEARLGERAAGIPEDLRVDGALEEALTRCREVQQELEAAFVTAQERAATTEKTRIARETAASSAAAALDKAVEEESVGRDDHLAALKAHGFIDPEEWQLRLLTEEQRSELQQALDAHRDALQQAAGRLKQAELALEAQPEARDVAELRVSAEQAGSEYAAAVSRHADARGLVAKLEGVKQRLGGIDGEADGVRREYSTVGVLAEVAGGQNPNRVSFQRWVLGVYLDEVLIAASRKLYTMSKGRYQLERQREAASRGRASGLDLAVFDEFSGASRPAVTLSGGESFLAALALALGLAQTVQEHSAGTPLETIFVDEGFGALDADALELAVDALMELQASGRLVGVISHVSELKQVIPARLEVRGGPAGSSTRFVVP